jgi:predicted TPR repeat methyltransferase
MGDDALWEKGARASLNHSRCGRAQRVAEEVAGLPEFPSFRKMLDLGGGAGIFAIAIVGAHPGMRGVVFDQPAVAKAAEEYIRGFEMEHRLRAVGGDYRSDVLGNDYDLIWACATLNFVKQDMDGMVKRIFEALNPGGVFISFHDGMTHEQTKPETMLGHFGYAMRTGRDFYLDQGFVADAMLRAGFRSVRSRTLETPVGAMDMDLARKAKAS